MKNFLAYSLQRLGVDHIDIYRPARLDPNVPIEDTIGAIADAIKAGWVRHIGLSEVGPETIRRAAAVHPVVDLQIEYSLMQRTVEGELIPMAQELGLGILPWSPLKAGALTGKYTRENGAKMQGPRGARVGDFTERQYDIIDAVASIATQCGVESSTVALAWLKVQPGVQSTIIGARTLEQLTSNLKALDFTLTPEQIASLTSMSKPVLNFPADFLASAPSLAHAGATVNGTPSQRMHLVPNEVHRRW